MSKFTISIFISLILLACSTPDTGNPWADFTQCANRNCLKEAIAVKDALVKSPKPMLEQFQATYEKGNDHVIGWLYFMRDSVLTNQSYGTLEQRTAIQHSVLTAIKPFFDDIKVEEMATSIAEVFATLDLSKPYEEEEAVEPLSIPLTGTYEYELSNSAGTGELLVSQISYDSFQFKLSIVGPPPAHNMGFMEGVAAVSHNGTAVYSTTEFGDECSLDLTFTKESVVITTLTLWHDCCCVV